MERAPHSFESKRNIDEAEEIEAITKDEPAAIMYGDQIFRGTSHMLAMMKLKAELPDFDDFSSLVDGFITTQGRFVDREEAEVLAEKAHQLEGDSIGYNGDEGSLDSKDLIH